MNVRKILLLGCAALVAAALAAPAAASAAEWKHGTEPLAGHVEIPLYGGEVITVPQGVVFCETSATLTAEPGSAGQIVNYELAQCTGFTGELAGCEGVAAEQTEGPWPVDVNSTDLTITNVAVTRTFDPECPVEAIESSVAAVGTTLYEPGAIAEFEYSGSGIADVDGEEVSYGSFGSYNVLGEAAGTYGIG